MDRYTPLRQRCTAAYMFAVRPQRRFRQPDSEPVNPMVVTIASVNSVAIARCPGVPQQGGLTGGREDTQRHRAEPGQMEMNGPWRADSERSDKIGKKRAAGVGNSPSQRRASTCFQRQRPVSCLVGLAGRFLLPGYHAFGDHPKLPIPPSRFFRQTPVNTQDPRNRSRYSR